VTFTATVVNGAAEPTFEWLVDGIPVAGEESAVYRNDSLANGDVVTCLITSDDACGLAKSNSVAVAVYTTPVITAGQIFTIPFGQQETLDPLVSGDVTSWLWTPGEGLSDSTVAHPVASPPATTMYRLLVTGPGGCADTGDILVNVYTPLSLPNAFTPNGDGRNDRFYVLGGPVNSVVESFAVFDRWGQMLFRVQDAAPGDASAGWDGRVHGQAAASGVYVYTVVMKYANGTRQAYRGTVVLVR
jgi:gliding motility-associated-like protein